MNKFKCAFCPSLLKTKKYLNQHQKRCSKNVNRVLHTCEYCGKNGIVHIYVHKERCKLRPFKSMSCESCGKTFTSLPGLQNHRRNNRCKPNNCRACQVEFKSSVSLAVHQVLSHSKNPADAQSVAEELEGVITAYKTSRSDKRCEYCGRMVSAAMWAIHEDACDAKEEAEKVNEGESGEEAASAATTTGLMVLGELEEGAGGDGELTVDEMIIQEEWIELEEVQVETLDDEANDDEKMYL